MGKAPTVAVPKVGLGLGPPLEKIGKGGSKDGQYAIFDAQWGDDLTQIELKGTVTPSDLLPTFRTTFISRGARA